jgi:hypothetical protein
MSSGENTKKDTRNSVYQKALVVCHEDEKQLIILQHEIEKDRLQTYIDYKLEAKRLKKELLTLRREQLQLMNEASHNLKERKTVDDIAKETTSVQSTRSRNLETMKLKKKFSLPHLTPTQRNIPKIMKRNLSYESEFFTWTFGVPQVDGQLPKLKGTCEKQQRKSFINSSESLESNKKQVGKAFHLPNTENRICTKKDKATLRHSKELRLPSISAAATKNNNVFLHATEKICTAEVKSKSDSKLPPIV